MELVEGVAVGHWTDLEARTGCTVVLLPEGTVASGEVRGGAPATREFALLEPTRLVERLDAVVLSGGSAFGLAAADGVVSALAARNVGFDTPHGVVPIVVGMSLYDLGVGSADVRPGPAEGAAALDAATSEPASGRIGAGAGATTGKWRGQQSVGDGGLGIATVESGPLCVSAIVAVNAAGDIDDGSTTAQVLAGERVWSSLGHPTSNTVIGVVVTNARLDKGGCHLAAQGAHDGLARAVFPPHMRTDGDAFVAAATGVVRAEVDQVRLMAVVAVEQAIRGSVGSL